MKYFAVKNGTLKITDNVVQAVEGGWVVDSNIYTHCHSVKNPIERIEFKDKIYEVELYNLSSFKIHFPDAVVESNSQRGIIRIIERIFDGLNIYNIIYLDGQIETSYGKSFSEALRNVGLGGSSVQHTVDYIEILNK